MLNVALSLVPAGDDDGQTMLLADTVAGAADKVVTPLIGVIMLVVLKADRIENQVIMDVIPVYVGGKDKFIFAAQDLPRQLHADPVGLLRRDLPRLKRLDEVPAQVRALVDGMAAGPGKFDFARMKMGKNSNAVGRIKPDRVICLFGRSPPVCRVRYTSGSPPRFSPQRNQ